VHRWKTGFYHIACGAGVPLVLAFLDYARKEGGLGPVFHPTGDLKADMADILAFYATVTGRHPERMGAVERGGLGCLDRKQGFISGILLWVHDHAAACFCGRVLK
jgi:hypothetical protein